MGYCDGACEHLTSRHNCKKYKKGLAYSSYSSKSLGYSCHERCSECDKDHYIKELQNKLKEIDFEALLREHPYKEPGEVRDTGREYNEGWSDAIERVRTLFSLLPI